MALNTAQLYLAIEPVVRKFIGMGRKKVTPVFSKIADVSSVDTPIREFYDGAGPGRLELKQENSPITVRSIKLGPVKRVQAATFAAALEISREAVMDVRERQIKTSSAQFGRAADLTPEYLFATFLDRSHSSAYKITPDNVELCSASHVTPLNTTFSNTLAQPASLSETAMEDIKTQLRATIGQDGMLAPVVLDKWIVPGALANLIKKLTGTPLALGSNNNDINVSSGDKFIVNDFLTNSTRFYAQTDHDNGFYWDWRESTQFERDNVALIQQAIFIAFFRAMWGAEDPRCVFASNAT